MAILNLKKINKVYPNGVHAVCNFEIDMEDKEFIVLVGPSGCGKSTLLRMISGLENISKGEFHIDNKVVNLISPKDRNIAMVFQSYALYPHMTVNENIAFSLKLRKVDKFTISEKIDSVANKLGLVNYLSRKPKELSGGQRQRVALGRAIVRNPKIFLMDEPLSNLDASLRQEMRILIKEIHQDLGVNTIYVTHDQIEAMTMADRIVVMSEGFVQQIGTPHEVFNNPANIFVASFIGSPNINLIDGKIIGGRFVGSGFDFPLPANFKNKLINYEGKNIILGVRPTDMHINDAVKMTHDETLFTLNVKSEEILGSEVILTGPTEKDKNHQNISIKIPYYEYSIIKNKGNGIQLALNVNKIHFFDPETELNVTVDNNEATKKCIANFINNQDVREERMKLMNLQRFKGESVYKISGVWNIFSKISGREHQLAKLDFKKSRINKGNTNKIDKKMEIVQKRIDLLKEKQLLLQHINFGKHNLQNYYNAKIKMIEWKYDQKNSIVKNPNKAIVINNKRDSKIAKISYKKSLLFNDAPIPKFTFSNLLSIRYWKIKKRTTGIMYGFNIVELNAKAKTKLNEAIHSAKLDKDSRLDNENNRDNINHILSDYKNSITTTKTEFKNTIKDNKEKYRIAKQDYKNKRKLLIEKHKMKG